MEKIEIRLAGKDDTQLIAGISKITFEETYSAYNSKENMNLFVSEQFGPEILGDELASGSNTFFLALLDGRPAGYLKLTEDQAPEGLHGKNAIEISRVYALQRVIGKGVGKALMQCAIDFAAEKEKEIIWLGVWEHNERAISFYSKWGFVKFGEHDFLLGNDRQNDWLMMKKIKKGENL